MDLWPQVLNVYQHSLLIYTLKSNRKFSIDEHRHYLFTPRDITTMIFSMLRYEIPEAQALIEILIYESNRVFRDRLVDRENKKKFDNILYAGLKNHLKY